MTNIKTFLTVVLLAITFTLSAQNKLIKVVTTQTIEATKKRKVTTRRKKELNGVIIIR